MRQLIARTVAVCGLACGLLLTPASTYAGCCGWFSGLFHKKDCVATFDPCSPCQAQTVSYVPQTCYRAQCVSVPVTTYRPVQGFDPCTGCPVTTCRPITTCVQQTRMVPFTTYRPVVSSPCATGLCGGATTASYAPAATYAPMATSGCSSCSRPAMSYAPVTSTPTYSTPSYASGTPMYTTPSYGVPTYTNPTPTYGTPANGTPVYTPSYPSTPTYTPSTVQPSLPPASGQTPTFQNNGSGGGALKPVPDPNINQSAPQATPTSSPRLIDPDTRTTRYPVYQAWAYSPVAWSTRPEVQPVSAVEPALVPATRPSAQSDDSDGWRPSNR
jgi:hypothetical protein